MAEKFRIATSNWGGTYRGKVEIGWKKEGMSLAKCLVFKKKKPDDLESEDGPLPADYLDLGYPQDNRAIGKNFRLDCQGLTPGKNLHAFKAGLTNEFARYEIQKNGTKNKDYTAIAHVYIPTATHIDGKTVVDAFMASMQPGDTTPVKAIILEK